jgi:hypothetical protein
VKRYGIKVYTIGVGNGRSVNMDILQEIAKATGGKSFLADSKNTIKEVYKQINNLEKSEINAEKYAQKLTFLPIHYFSIVFIFAIFLEKKLMSFENPNFLFLIILPAVLWFFIKSKSLNIESFFSKEVLEKISVSKHSSSPALRLKLLILSIIFMIFAISRPVINNGEVELEKQLSELIIAVDISKSMLVSDIYPNRFEFAKNKLITSLDDLKNIQIGVIGFADQSFLVSPLTDDFLSLKTLITNLNIGNINLSGTNILSAVQTAMSYWELKIKMIKTIKIAKLLIKINKYYF